MLSAHCLMTQILTGYKTDSKVEMENIELNTVAGGIDDYKDLDEEDKEMIERIEELRQQVLSSCKFNKVSKQMLEGKLGDLQRTLAVLSEANYGRGTSLSYTHRQRLDHWKQVLLANMKMGDDMYTALVDTKVITDEQADELRALGSRRRQCESLLDLIVLLGDKSYGGFLNALSKCGQEFLVDILTSEIDVKTPYYCENSSWETCYLGKPDVATLTVSCFPKSSNAILLDIFSKAGDQFVFENGTPRRTMCEVYQKALIKNYVRLTRELFAEILFDSLIEDEILTSDVTEGIFLVGSRHRMNQVLLHILPFLGDDAFVSFSCALKKTGQDHLAVLLEDFVKQHTY